MGWCVREYICVLDDMREDARAVCVCVCVCVYLPFTFT